MIFDRMLMPALALATAIAWCGPAGAEETGKSEDEALDSLLQKLERPGGDLTSKKESQGSKPQTAGADGKAAARPSGTIAPSRGEKAGKDGKPATKAASGGKNGSGEVATQDKEIDELLEKLGETRDEPAAEEHSRSRSQPVEPDGPSRPDAGGGPEHKTKPSSKPRSAEQGLEGKDKELDAKLEELLGKKRKKNREQQEDGSGPLGEIIKEMRDVEQRLGKPETGDDTQSRQKQIVKRIETLIQQIKQSGSSGSMAMRMVRQPGQKPGNQQGQNPGANAAGAPPMKPMKPSDRHAPAGGQDVWGHLPPELRQEMENSFKEEALDTKAELIRRYYLSVAKQRLVRGD